MIKSIERENYKVHFKTYSNKLYGARVVINDECHYFINEDLPCDIGIKTLYRLRDLGTEYANYGFIVLQEDNKIFIDPNYRYKNNTLINRKDNVISFTQYKQSRDNDE